MNTTHTPGPWSVGAPTGLVNQISILPCIGVVYGAGDEIKANAALIAAAPDMYEALKEVLRVADANGIDAHYSRAVYFVRAALAKAGRQ